MRATVVPRHCFQRRRYATKPSIFTRNIFLLLRRYYRGGEPDAVPTGVRIELRAPVRQRTGPGVRYGRPDVPEQVHDASGNM